MIGRLGLCARSSDWVGRAKAIWVMGARSEGSKAAKEVEYQLSNFPVGVDANIVYGSSFGRAEYKPRHIEDNGVASVEVGDRNNIDQPFNTLRRKCKQEGFAQIWKQRKHVKASIKRRLQQQQKEYRAYKREIEKRMKWVDRLINRSY